MKKTTILSIVLLIYLMAFVTCSSNKNGSNNSGSFYSNVQYIRTNGYNPNTKYPIITVISSKNELGQYYGYYKDKYDLSARSQVSSDSTIGFIDAIKDYSEEYFIKNFLLIVLLEEGSGSIRHKVEMIDVNGKIVISRLLPELGTDDMAEWNIIIELNNNLKLKQFNAVFIDKLVS